MLATKKIINRDDYNGIVFMHFLSERIMSSDELCMYGSLCVEEENLGY